MAVKRVSGVMDASFSYEEGSGSVTFDEEETDPAAFIAELADKTGFVARVVGGDNTSTDDSESGER